MFSKTASIDLLQTAIIPAGAEVDPSGIMVSAIWGRVGSPPMALVGGWYTVEADAPVIILIEDVDRHSLLEIECDGIVPARFRLAPGKYIFSLMAGGRPGHYKISRAILKLRSTLDVTTFLARRFFQAITSRVGFGQILSAAGRAFSRNTSFGARQSATNPVALGLMSGRDRSGSMDYRAEARLGNLKTAPCFHVCYINGERVDPDLLQDQFYTSWTVVPDALHEFEIRITQGEKLRPDALLLFAEYLAVHPDTTRIIADLYEGDTPTARVAWDVALYEESIPTPYLCIARSIGAKEHGRGTCGVLSIPVACTTSGRAEVVAVRQSVDHAPCSIIIPTRDRADLLSACLEGLFDKTLGQHEVIVVDNGSVEKETFELFERWKPKGLRVLPAPIPFNFSRLCNMGAEVANSRYLLFLNNDVVLKDSGWLSEMMLLASQPHVGAVGARLLYPDGRLQHGGIALGLTQTCGHPWRGLTAQEQSMVPQLSRNSMRSAVTGACLCVAREKFEEVGGFDEERFPVTLNDVDLCLKLQAQGWATVFASRAVAFHMEGESRGEDRDLQKLARRLSELEAFRQKWHLDGHADPWLSEALSKTTERLGYR